MGKRSRLRGSRRGKGRLLIMMVLAGLFLFLGLHFFGRPLERLHRHVAGESESPSERLLKNRGAILDRNYKEMAVTLEKVSVYANVRDIESEKVIERLAPVLGKKPARLQHLLESEPYRAWLAKNISQETEEKVAELGLQGVYLDRARVRYYPQKTNGAHVVGFVGEGMGLAGVEYSYNSLLNGYKSSLLESGAESIPREAGNGSADRYLVLTLDMKIQRKLEKLVAGLGRQREKSRVAAMLVETATGKVIGEAVYPSYDPNSFHDYEQDVLSNVLAEPIAVPHKIRQLLWDASVLQYRFERDGETTPWTVGNSQRGLGTQLKMWERLGLNDPLDVDFASRAGNGGVNERRQGEVGGELLYDSLPQSATPLHLLAAVNGLVMGGAQPKLHSIDRIAGADGDVLKLPVSRRKAAVAEPVARELRKMLETQAHHGPVSSGYFETDSLAYTELPQGRGYARNKMFFSLIPRDKPELLFFVFAQLPTFSPSPAETKNGVTLAEAANKVTVSMVAMQQVMANLLDMMVLKEKNEMNFQLQREVENRGMLRQAEENQVLGTMPYLKGMSLRKSLRLLQDLRLEIQISGTGVVVQQDPLPGQPVKRDQLCRLVLKPH